MQIFAQKHSRDSKERWLSGNTMCFRMNRISDVYFVGGFGTVQWLDVAEYMAATPDSIVMHQPLRVLQVGHSMQIMPGVMADVGMASRVTGKTAHAGVSHAAHP